MSSQLAGHVGGKGTITFQADAPLAEDTVRAVVSARRAEIDAAG